MLKSLANQIEGNNRDEFNYFDMYMNHWFRTKGFQVTDNVYFLLDAVNCTHALLFSRYVTGYSRILRFY